MTAKKAIEVATSYLQGYPKDYKREMIPMVVKLISIAERAGDVQWLTMQYLIWVHLSPEEQNKVDLGSFISQRILNGEGKDGGE